MVALVTRFHSTLKALFVVKILDFSIFRILESPFACIEEATNGFYDYFGFNITYACRGAEDTIDSVKRQWRSIINPYCGASVPENYVCIEHRLNLWSIGDSILLYQYIPQHRTAF